jgi:nucleoside-diphosphate-sugar epimerase
MSERVFLTGASGRIGRFVLDGLLAEGYSVRALAHRGKDGFPVDPRVDVFTGDILDRESLGRGMEGCAYAVHLAAAWDMFPPAIFEKDNDQLFDSVIRGSYNLLEACRSLKDFKALVYASTDAVYSTGPRHFDAPITEDTELKPSRFYAVAKIACETLCRQYGNLYGMPWLIVRICWALRPEELLRVFSYEFWEGGMSEDDRSRLRPKLGNGRGLFAPLCADGSSGVDHIADPQDIAAGIVRAVVKYKEGRGGTFNLAGPRPFRYLDVIEKPAKRLGLPWDCARIPGIEPYELRNDRAAGVLGYAPAWTMERMLEKAAEERLAANRGGRS